MMDEKIVAGIILYLTSVAALSLWMKMVVPDWKTCFKIGFGVMTCFIVVGSVVFWSLNVLVRP